MKRPSQPIRRVPHPPFTRLDALLLVGFAVLAIGVVLLEDREFFDRMAIFASGKAPWTNLPEWVSDLELPAKRIENDFAVFLIVMSLGVASVCFRRRAAWCFVGLPRPGVAATAATAIVLLAHELGAQIPYWYHRVSVGFVLKVVPTVWHLGLETSIVETEVTAAILGVWAYLLLARGWKARDDWRDWLGRWLAWCWVSTLPFHVLAIAIWG
jgi:hypothetical protein